MSDNQSVEQQSVDLMEQLTALRDDRGAMANLRRGFSSATEDRAWPWIARWCDITNDRQRAIYAAVAAAFATHPEIAVHGDLGAVMQELAQRNQKGEEGLKSFGATFQRFLNCHSPQEVCERLPAIVRMAKQQGVAVNYRQLFIDLCYWGNRVKVRWASAYWGKPKDADESQGDAA